MKLKIQIVLVGKLFGFIPVRLTPVDRTLDPQVNPMLDEDVNLGGFKGRLELDVIPLTEPAKVGTSADVVVSADTNRALIRSSTGEFLAISNDALRALWGKIGPAIRDSGGQ